MKAPRNDDWYWGPSLLGTGSCHQITHDATDIPPKAPLGFQFPKEPEPTTVTGIRRARKVAFNRKRK